MLLSILFAAGGGGNWLDDPSSLIHSVAKAKSDTAKCILIFWCLFAFVAAGYEHGVANMTVFTISMLGSHTLMRSLLGGGFYNLAWVSVCNIIGGAGFIGGCLPPDVESVI